MLSNKLSKSIWFNSVLESPFSINVYTARARFLDFEKYGFDWCQKPFPTGHFIKYNIKHNLTKCNIWIPDDDFERELKNWHSKIYFVYLELLYQMMFIKSKYCVCFWFCTYRDAHSEQNQQARSFSFFSFFWIFVEFYWMNFTCLINIFVIWEVVHLISFIFLES